MSKVRAVILGCGKRAEKYCDAAYKTLGEDFEIVALVNRSSMRLEYMCKKYGLPESICYHSYLDVVNLGKIGDIVINSTMDKFHVETTIPFLEQGYDVLLEKPVSTNMDEIIEVKKVAERTGRHLIIGHVLRYTAGCRAVKDVIDAGTIGKIINIETSERIGLDHSSVSFIRGDNNKESQRGSGLLLVKCCHDMDLGCWWNNKTVPVKATSIGGRHFLTLDNAPEGAGERCMVDCPHNSTCKYSAENMYIKHNDFPWIPFRCTGKDIADLTEEEKIESLKTTNPHGICAYRSDSDLVDHQTVTIEFANGSTFTHFVTQGIVRAGRNLYIQGTDGEIEGFMDEGRFVVRTFDYESKNFVEKEYDVSKLLGEDDGHFGGDQGIMDEFLTLIKGGTPSVSCTPISDSIYGHLCVFAAEKSRLSGGIPYVISYDNGDITIKKIGE